MVTLRVTRKLFRKLPQQEANDVVSDTALGDWYANQFFVDRKPLLILVSSLSLLTIILPARNVKALPKDLPEMVAARLRRLSVAPVLLDAEVAAMNPVHVGPTQDRSVVASMVAFAQAIPFHMPDVGWDETMFPMVEHKLEQMPWRLGNQFKDMIVPNEMVPELLESKWRKDGRPTFDLSVWVHPSLVVGGMLSNKRMKLTMLLRFKGIY